LAFQALTAIMMTIRVETMTTAAATTAEAALATAAATHQQRCGSCQSARMRQTSNIQPRTNRQQTTDSRHKHYDDNANLQVQTHTHTPHTHT